MKSRIIQPREQSVYGDGLEIGQLYVCITGKSANYIGKLFWKDQNQPKQFCLGRIDGDFAAIFDFSKDKNYRFKLSSEDIQARRGLTIWHFKNGKLSMREEMEPKPLLGAVKMAKPPKPPLPKPIAPKKAVNVADENLNEILLNALKKVEAKAKNPLDNSLDEW